MNTSTERQPWLRSAAPDTRYNPDTDLYDRTYPAADEREHRALFSIPTQTNARAGVEVVEDAERADLIEDKALAELEGASDRVRQVMATQGRHTSNRLADEHQARRDQIDAADAVRDAAPDWTSRHRAHLRAETARARMADTTSGRPGVNQLSDLGYQRWAEHCANEWGVPPAIFLDDLAYDEWLEQQGAACPAEEHHYAAADQDDDLMEDVR